MQIVASSIPLPMSVQFSEHALNRNRRKSESNGMNKLKIIKSWIIRHSPVVKVGVAIFILLVGDILFAEPVYQLFGEKGLGWMKCRRRKRPSVILSAFTNAKGHMAKIIMTGNNSFTSALQKFQNNYA
jgi:hypothetical protein